MDTERWQEVHALLNDVLDLPPEKRAAYLDEQCAGDAELREEVESLLEAHEEAGSFLASADEETASTDSDGAPIDPLIGEEVDDFQIRDVLGRGGMGTVYEAEDTALSRTVALKRINPDMARDASFLRRFRSEARALARIDSPYIVSIYALRQTEKGLFIVMEYVEGGTLADPMKKGTMDVGEAVRIFKQMLRALADAHQADIIHRDIKPQNIMLADDGRVKVTDFGLARKQQRGTQATVTQAMAGTLNYMSPEQVKNPAEVDHRSDLYSLGVTFYEMLAGRLPFEEDSSDFDRMQAIVSEQFPPPDTHRPDLDDALVEFVMKAMAKSPEDRYQSAGAMLDALEDFEMKGAPDKEPAPAGAAEASSSSSGFLRQNGWVPRVALGVILFVLLSMGTYYWDQLGAESSESNPSPVTATLFVSSEPDGATIHLNGDSVGLTPLQDYSVPSDSVIISLQKKGFEARDTVLYASAEKDLSLDMRLARLSESSPSEEGEQGTEDETIPSSPGSEQPTQQVSGTSGGGDESEPTATLALGVEPSGTVEVNGKQLSSGEHSVPVGRQTITFSHPEYPEYDKDTTLTLSAGETETLTCYFEHELNVLTTAAWAGIWIDREHVGNSPIIELRRGPGTYRVEARIRRSPDLYIDGGQHRITKGEQEWKKRFSGSVRTVEIKPSFQEEKHVLVFRVR